MRKSDSCNRGMVSKGNKGSRGLRLWFQRNMPINFAQSVTAALTPWYSSAGRTQSSRVVPGRLFQVNLKAKRFGVRIRRRKQRCSRGRGSKERRNLMRVPIRGAYLMFRAKMNGPAFLRRFGAQTWQDAREIAAPRARMITNTVNSTLVSIQETKEAGKTRLRRSSNWSEEWWRFLQTERSVYHVQLSRKDKNLFSHPGRGEIFVPGTHPAAREVEYCDGTGVTGLKCLFWHRRHFIDYQELKSKIESL